MRVLKCCECVWCMRVLGVMSDPELLGELPWVVYVVYFAHILFGV